MSTIATDRHPSVTKILREDYPKINHQFDLWHIVKNIRKKLLAKKIPELTEWVRCIANHLWFCASTCGGSADVLIEKWLSVLHHIKNEHEWASGTHLTGCEHPPYEVQEERKRPWLKEESKAFKALQTVVTDKKLLKDLKQVLL